MLKKNICTIFICLSLVGTSFAVPFTDNGDATVSDGATGLMWQQTDDDIKRTWQSALDYCNALILAEYKDWRLPEITELELIGSDDDSGYRNTILDPAIDRVAFPGTNSADYWAGTTYARDPRRAWVVYFEVDGVGSSHKSNKNYARCVRVHIQFPTINLIANDKIIQLQTKKLETE